MLDACPSRVAAALQAQVEAVNSKQGSVQQPQEKREGGKLSKQPSSPSAHHRIAQRWLFP